MSVVTVMPHDRDWTVADLEQLPDDGFRYELFDGMLVVSPSPTPAHQRAVRDIAFALHQGCPRDLEVFFAPLDFQPNDRRSFQPDVLVVRRDRIGKKNLTEPPLLVVEVLSPSTRGKDQLLKKSMYESSGVASYWIYDPDDRELVAFDLIDGAYQEVARAVGAEEVTLHLPFEITLRPGELGDL